MLRLLLVVVRALIASVSRDGGLVRTGLAAGEFYCSKFNWARTDGQIFLANLKRGPFD